MAWWCQAWPAWKWPCWKAFALASVAPETLGCYIDVAMSLAWYPPQKMWKSVTCDEMWYHNVWLHLTAFQGTYWQRAWWRRKYAFGQKVFKVLYWVPVFTVEFIFLRFDIDWISSLQVSSPFSSAYSLSFHFPCPVPISSFRSLGVLCFFPHLRLLMLGAGWNRMEPDGTGWNQLLSKNQGEELAHMFSIPKGRWGEAVRKSIRVASCPLVHWSQLNYHQVDLREWNREATRHSIMSPEDLGWIQKQCTFIILVYILHPLAILTWLIMHHDPWHQWVRQARRQGVLSRLAVPWVHWCTLFDHCL